ncbi:hypothetical protein BGZ46_005367 [Entomortierella lignicola]|nr:hypothetical protein BGZ46_005367 [Entomortierella lignicola]
MSLFSRRALPPKVALQLAETHLGSAKQADDPVLKWSLCVNADKELSRIKKSARNALITSRKPEDQEICSRISEAYAEHVRILVSLRSVKQSKVKRSFINMIKWYIQKRVERAIDSTPDTSPAPTEPVINQQSVIDDAQDNSDTTQSPSDINSQIISDNSNTNIPESVTGSATASGDSTQVTPSIFLLNTPGPEIPYHLPSPDEPITSTPQLVYCLRLLSMDVPSTIESNKPLSETERWIRSRANDVEEKERLHLLSKKILAEFMSDELKDSAAVAEVIYLAPVLDKEYYRKLLNKFIDGIDRSTLLDFSLLEGLAQQIQCAPPECLHHDDLVKILDSLRVRLQSTHQQSTNHLYQLTVAISRVLDAMADSDVKGLKREELHAPLLKYLRELKDSSDPYLVFQAAYAHQALQYIPDDETQWKSLLRHTKMVVGGIAGIVTAVKKLDVNEFLNSLDHIHDGLWEVCKFAKTTAEWDL